MKPLDASFLPAPKVAPPLDPAFRPAALARRAIHQGATGGQDLLIALEREDGTVFHHRDRLLPAAQADNNLAHVERLLKFLLWSRGGFRFHLNAPTELVAGLRAHYAESAAGKFDSEMVSRIFGAPIEIVASSTPPAARASSTPLGRHLNGNRIGFDLGGSDRKVAALIEGEVIFSEETVWDPYYQPDPQYHFDGIMDSLHKAAAHLPRVDAIGGSSAGVYVNNRVKIASLFRGVPDELFKSRAADLFLEVQKAWKGVPFQVINDGEVTALAGAMSLGENAVLGIALGTSTAGGYVNPEGNLTAGINEYAFVPVDQAAEAPRDEWSLDGGCGVQYFSQQAVGRLLAPAGIDLPADMPLPKKLEEVQALMKSGDDRARRIYETIGVYLGYGLAHFANFYDFRHVLVLGRVTSGQGGAIINDWARKVLAAEFPALAGSVKLDAPDEKQKRHGQAIAAASLPSI